MKDCVLSIIIPVYNMENFLDRCLDSFTCMSEYLFNYEIIVVNDGSTDNSKSIIDDYTCRFDFIKVVEQSNSGLGESRNNGLSVAEGRYVWFVDSDDFIEPSSLNIILKELGNYAYDVLTLNYRCADEAGLEIDWLDFTLKPEGEMMSGPNFYKINYKYSYIWLYIFKRELITSNYIKFQKRINMQDSDFIPRVMTHADNVKISNIKAYYYVKRLSSFINNPDCEVRYTYFKSAVKVYELLDLYQIKVHDNTDLVEGLTKKLLDIERILFMSFLYEKFPRDKNIEAIESLKSLNIFPFSKSNYNLVGFKFNILRLLLNFKPLITKNIFFKFRQIKDTFNG